MGKLASLYTAQDHDCVRVSIPLPDGTDSGEWVEMYGADSPQYRAALGDMRRALLAGASPGMTDEARAELVDRETAVIMRKVIRAWSFDDPLSADSVAAMVKNARYIVDALDAGVSLERVAMEKKRKTLLNQLEQAQPLSDDPMAAQQPTESTTRKSGVRRESSPTS